MDINHANNTITSSSGAVLTLPVVSGTPAKIPVAVSITNTVSLTSATNAGNINIISGSNSFTATLPTAVGFIGTIPIKIDEAYSGVFNLATISSQTIDNQASPQQFYAGESFTLFSDNANWKVI